MDKKERLFELINHYRKTEFFNTVLKFIPFVILVSLAPVAIVFLFVEKKIFEPIVLILAVGLISINLPELVKDYKRYKSPENCLLRQSILNPESVKEIIIYPDKLYMDIKGSENYEIKLREGVIKDELIDIFIEYFGKDRIVKIIDNHN